MGKLIEQRGLTLTPDQWQRLEALAEQTNSRARSGPNTLGFSWRTLISRIAAGDFHLTEKKPYKLPDGLEEAAKLAGHRPSRLRPATLEAAGAREKPLTKLEQLNMEFEPA